VYALLLKKYAQFLADSRMAKEQKEREKLLYMMESTAISLFDGILLKGVGRKPGTGKKKGGMKIHMPMKYTEGVPTVVDLTSAAGHDHYLLKESIYPKIQRWQSTVHTSIMHNFGDLPGRASVMLPK
jgi:hypothetical protein